MRSPSRANPGRVACMSRAASNPVCQLHFDFDGQEWIQLLLKTSGPGLVQSSRNFLELRGGCERFSPWVRSLLRDPLEPSSISSGTRRIFLTEAHAYGALHTTLYSLTLLLTLFARLEFRGSGGATVGDPSENDRLALIISLRVFVPQLSLWPRL